MSLEIAIQQNTEALNALIGLLSKMSPIANAKAAEKRAPASVSKAPATSPAVASPPATATQAAAPEASEPAKVVIYEEVKQITMSLVKAKGKEVASAILQEFGAEKAPELKAEQYAAYVAKAQAALAG